MRIDPVQGTGAFLRTWRPCKQRGLSQEGSRQEGNTLDKLLRVEAGKEVPWKLWPKEIQGLHAPEQADHMSLHVEETLECAGP